MLSMSICNGAQHSVTASVWLTEIIAHTLLCQTLHEICSVWHCISHLKRVLHTTLARTVHQLRLVVSRCHTIICWKLVVQLHGRRHASRCAWPTVPCWTTIALPSCQGHWSSPIVQLSRCIWPTADMLYFSGSMGSLVPVFIAWNQG